MIEYMEVYVITYFYFCGFMADSVQIKNAMHMVFGSGNT